MFKVLIDPGHAPGNANKGPTGYYEYEGNWRLATYLQQILKQKNIQADLTKSFYEDPQVYDRGIKATNYDLFISEHSNANDGTVRGVEVYYDFNKEYDKINAERLSKVVSQLMDNVDRGAKTRVVKAGSLTYNYYGVIRGAAMTNCKHIFLIENGFHDNIRDEAFLKVDENLRRIAQAQADIICTILGVNKMTLEEAKEIIQKATGFDNNSMLYLEMYRYGETPDGMIMKLARAIKGE